MTEIIAHATEIIAKSLAFISVADALILEIEIKACLAAFISVEAFISVYLAIISVMTAFISVKAFISVNSGAPREKTGWTLLFRLRLLLWSGRRGLRHE